jgi:hypothetical protein
MGLYLMIMISLSSSVRIAHTACYLIFFLSHHIQVLCQYKLCKADLPIICILYYNCSLVTWMVISLTTAMFKPLIFSMSGFALSYTMNMFILMILYDFSLLSAQFCYIIIYICRRLKAVCKSWTGVQLGKFPVVWKTLFCRRCNLKRLIPRPGRHKSLLI